MKREKLTLFPMGFLMACLLSMGAMGSMLTGLDLPVDDPGILYLVWALAALAGSTIFLFKRGWIAALVITAAGLIWLWPEYSFTLPARALITRLSVLYDSAYGWGVLEFAGVDWKDVPLDLLLAVWGCLIALAAAGTVMQRRWTALTLILASLPVASTVVVTNTAPDVLPLYIWMLGMILLLLTATVRRQNPGQGAVLTAMTALPVAALLGLLFHFCPPDGYVNRSEEYLDSVVSWWQNTVTLSFDNTGLVDQTPVSSDSSATANLSRVGPRNTWAYTVLEAEADYTGTVYLRGQDFDVYDGTSWTARKNREETFGGIPSYGSWIYDGEITVRTATAANVLYLPYYPTQEQSLVGGQIDNENSLREYSFGVRHPQYTDLYRFDYPGNAVAGAASEPAGTVPPGQRYTQLPSDTRRWAVPYLQAHFDSSLLNAAENHLIAEAVASHVRGLVPYDTDTPRMAGHYNDFVQWFLEEAETGYCVHFASATAVLLRAAGVPARYVTGYMFEAAAGENVEVTADQAHAWVEYYHDGLNAWIVLEPTPADLREEETRPVETQPPEQATPDTQPPTEEDGEEATRPVDPGSDGEEPPETDLTWLWTALKWLLVPAALWLAVLVQYTLRRKLRPRPHSPNALALTLWQDVEAICRFTRQEPPEALETLAQKAKFSQHTLTGEELHVFRLWLTEERTKLRQQPWHRRFVYRYVLALW